MKNLLLNSSAFVLSTAIIASAAAAETHLSNAQAQCLNGMMEGIAAQDTEGFGYSSSESALTDEGVNAHIFTAELEKNGSRYVYTVTAAEINGDEVAALSMSSEFNQPHKYRMQDQVIAPVLDSEGNFVPVGDGYLAHSKEMLIQVDDYGFAAAVLGADGSIVASEVSTDDMSAGSIATQQRNFESFMKGAGTCLSR